MYSLIIEIRKILSYLFLLSDYSYLLHLSSLQIPKYIQSKVARY